jgi:signal transduction histidine kinase/CheY-like chemotaxis protein
MAVDFFTDAVDTEATKSDFVSSLSHELRSPLHGCLAAVEILRETALDKSQTDLLEMIESCADTLLYTMNHLLDFSNINDLDRTQSKNRRSSQGETTPNPSRNVFGRTVEDYLCRLVQDVVDGVSYGHAREQASLELELSSVPQYHTMRFDSDISIAKNRDVAVFLDMECHAAWFSIIPAGAWKRLVMNLFGNALKFCPRGHIEVTLKLIPDHQNPNKKMAHLMVSDTGLGMSEKFLKHSLYRPFVQANSLVSGNGLGLNIVKQIVNDLQGKINVKSTLGAGTRFDVFIPMIERDEKPGEVIVNGGQMLDPEALLNGRTLCLLNSPRKPSEGADASLRRTNLVHSYVKSIAQDWFHMKVVYAEMTEEVDADIYIAEVSDYGNYICSASESSSMINRHGVILVGNTHETKQARHEYPHNFIELNYPLGPQTLLRTLHAALKMPINQAYQTEAALPTAEAEQYDEGQMDVDSTSRESKNIPSEPSIQTTPADPIGTDHLLLVDDNVINLKILSTFVKKLSYNARTAVDGEDAFETYKTCSKTQPFTTILLDISMPKMNGFESSRAIRSFELENNLPPARIIALTALGSEASRREAEASGIDEFQMKPVALKTLKGLLQSSS